MKTLLYFVHTHWWLGHLKRISNIISQINRDFSWVYKHIVLISWEYQERWFFSDTSIRCIFLPCYQVSDISSIDFSIEKNQNVQKLRKKVYYDLLKIRSFSSLIVEHFPFWRFQMREEIIFLIQLFRKKNPESSVFSSVRDIFDYQDISEQYIFLFDRIFIHWSEEETSLHWSEEEKKKFIFTGYVLPQLTKSETNNHILISLWWWRDGFDSLRECIKKISLLQYTGTIYIACWKIYNSDIEKELLLVFPEGNMVIKSSFPHYDELKSSAQIFITQGGYNDFFEAYSLDIPTLLIPRLTDNEQQKRALWFLWKNKGVFLFSELSEEKLLKLLSSKTSFQRDTRLFSGSEYTASIVHGYKTFPFLKFRLSNACNASCDMCWVIRRPRVKNNFQKIQQVITEFSHIGGEIINFTGWEPTIYPWFYELVHFSKKIWLKVSLSTHGYNLHENFVGKLMDKENFLIDFIDISVDALYEKHDKIRWIPWLFSSLIESIKIIKKYHTKIHINYTVRADNIDTTLQFINFFRWIWIDSFSFSFIDFSPFHNTHFLLPTREQIKKFYLETQKVIESYSLVATFTPDNTWYHIDAFIDAILDHHNFPKDTWDHCIYIQQKKEVRINETWDISPCCEIDDYSPSIGNINQDSLLSILWKPYHSFLEKTFPHISPACKSCKIYIPKPGEI